MAISRISAHATLTMAIWMALAGTAQAQAQQAPADKVVELDTMVVTAQKRAENPQDVPVSISVVGADQIKDFHATQLTDIAAYVPGLQVESGGTPGQTIISLRGVAPVGPGQTVGIYLDDTPVGSSSFYARGAEFSLDLLPYDIERIEVLRGPQGTLYGASSIGGLLKYVAREPSLTEFSGNVGADWFGVAHGDDAGYALRAAIDAPLIEGKLGLTASYGTQRTPGYIDNLATGEKDQNEVEQRGGRVALRWEPNEDVSLQVSAISQTIEADNNATSLINAGPPESQFGDGLSNDNLVAEPFRKKFDYYSATLNWDLGFANFVSATSYSKTDTRQVQDGTGSFGGLYPIFGFDAGLAPFQLDLDLTKWTQEFRLASHDDGAFKWLIGGFYTDEKSGNGQVVTAQTLTGDPIPSIDPFAVVGLPTTYKEYAFFGDFTYKFSDRFDLSAGVRYAHNEQTFRQITTGPLFELLGSVRDDPGESSEGVVTYSFSPQFHIDKDVMLYARVATGYRPGGPNVLLTGFEKPQVDSDSLTNYEIGLKSEFLERRLLVNVAAFYMDWKDIQVTVACPGVAGCSFLDNAATAESKGFELTTSWFATSRLQLGLTAAYVDAELTEDALSIGGADGDRLPFIPKLSGSVTANYSFDLGGYWTAQIGGGYRYVGDRVTAVESSPNMLTIDNYYAVDLNAQVTNERWTFRLFAKNVTDSDGIMTKAAGDPGFLIANRLQPRTIGVSVDLKF